MPAQLPSIEEIAKEYALTYHLDLLEFVGAVTPLTGQRVLEIGGALPEELVVGNLGVERWVAVDYFEEYKALRHRGHDFHASASPRAVRQGQRIFDPHVDPIPDAPWSRFDGDAGDLSSAFDDQFDLVVSIATFEHIADLPGTLRALRRALRPGGTLALLVGPIWSGSRGHHVFETYFPDFPEQTQAFVRDLPPWGHLLSTRSEMFRANRDRFGAEFAELINFCIYESPHLNRLFADEYFAYFDLHGFRTLKMSHWSPHKKARIRKLRRRFPPHRGFEMDGFTCLLQAPG